MIKIIDKEKPFPKLMHLKDSDFYVYFIKSEEPLFVVDINKSNWIYKDNNITKNQMKKYEDTNKQLLIY